MILGEANFPFENEYDNKVSRNHAELLVTDDEVTLTALHSNPCFYMKKQHKSVQVLNKDSCIVLGCGDKFGILPHIYWYELIFCSQLPEDAESAKDNKKEGNQWRKRLTTRICQRRLILNQMKQRRKGDSHRLPHLKEIHQHNYMNGGNHLRMIVRKSRRPG
ncbi:uncharacterized protein LOC119192927 isoform X1 [Manduca sexta]|uniref:uncharacterized protein LOC119192927 isoform X1 n=1 Tax=Manduca sexta TaxID=7130 RepID=UPI00188EC282|nr:uncharacterized protein LOC119192927 isoform X1 [Manduca sexta]